MIPIHIIPSITCTNILSPVQTNILSALLKTTADYSSDMPMPSFASLTACTSIISNATMYILPFSRTNPEIQHQQLPECSNAVHLIALPVLHILGV